MINIQDEQREKIIKNLGGETTNLMLELFDKIEKCDVSKDSNEANTFIDRIVFELGRHVPEIQHRFHKLTVETKSCEKRLSLLLYIIKSHKISDID